MKRRLIWVALLALGILALPVFFQFGEALQTSSPSLTGPASKPVIQPTTAQDRLFILNEHSAGLAVVDGTSGAQALALAQAVAASDGSVLYSVDYAGGKTKVRAVDAATGRSLRETSIAGNYHLPRVGMGAGGLSPDGRWLALQDPPYAATPGSTRVTSRFLVLDTAFEGPPRQVEFDGFFEFDALSNDGRSLYLAEYPEGWSASPTPGSTEAKEAGPTGHEAQPPTGREAQSPSYQVRRYDLAERRLDPAVIVDKRNGERIMLGQRHAAVASPDGQWLYSLYLNDATGPFIHALNLDERYALCIDLPAEVERGGLDSELWGMALSPDGQTLYTINAGLGTVIEVDTQDRAVRRTSELALPEADAGGLLSRLARWLVPAAEAKIMVVNAAAISPDGQTLFALAREGILIADTASLSVRDHYLAGRQFNSLALNPGATHLYVVSMEPNQILRLDAATGEILGEMDSRGLWWGILRVASAARPPTGREAQPQSDGLGDSTNTVVIPDDPPNTCPVTQPPDPPFNPPPPYPANAPYEDEFWYGTEALWTMLRADGTWRGLPHHEKGYTQKVFWWRQGYDMRTEPEPALTVTGRRLDAPAPPLVASTATNAYHADFKSAMLVGVDVPTPGCWEITGSYAGDELSFVVRVSP